MRSKALITGVLGFLLFLQGCSTFKGAKEGFKEDWKVLMKTDDWIKEHLW